MSRARKNRRRRARSTLRTAGLVLCTVLTAALSTAGSIAAARWTASHPYFGLREVEVDGARDPEAVLREAGLARGRSLWTIDVDEARFRLLENPRVRAVELRREFPDRLRVVVEERRPLAIVLFEPPVFVDADAAVFPPSKGERIGDHPIVTGIRRIDLDERPGWASRRLRQAVRLVELWQHRADWPELSEVRLELDTLVVHPRRIAMSIRFSADVDDEELARLSAIFELWRGRETQVAGIDVSVPGEAIVKLKRMLEVPAPIRRVGI